MMRPQISFAVERRSLPRKRPAVAARPAAPAMRALEPIGSLAADVTRILAGRTTFPETLWSRVI